MLLNDSGESGNGYISVIESPLNETIEVGPGNLKMSFSVMSGQLQRMFNSKTGVSCLHISNKKHLKSHNCLSDFKVNICIFLRRKYIQFLIFAKCYYWDIQWYLRLKKPVIVYHFIFVFSDMKQHANIYIYIIEEFHYLRKALQSLSE